MTKKRFFRRAKFALVQGLSVGNKIPLAGFFKQIPVCLIFWFVWLPFSRENPQPLLRAAAKISRKFKLAVLLAPVGEDEPRVVVARVGPNHREECGLFLLLEFAHRDFLSNNGCVQ